MLVAIGAVPALLKMDVPLLPAHLFCFIFAAFSHITPPVAIGALVASRMAGANYWKTNWEAIKAAFVAFLLPYLIVFVPLVVMKPRGGWVTSVMEGLSIISMIIACQMGLSGYCFNHLDSIARLVFMAATLANAVYLFTQNNLFFWLGLAVFLSGLFWQYSSNRQDDSCAPVMAGE
jgi:TRAP-type uncharacterized transport system fused permease subunit